MDMDQGSAKSPTWEVLERMEKEMACLAEATQALESKLGVVMRDPPGGEAGSLEENILRAVEVPERPTSPLLRKLEVLHRALVDRHRSVLDLADRVVL